MILTRRNFLSSLVAVGVAATVPEIWTPKKTIFLPPVGGWRRVIGIDLGTGESQAVIATYSRLYDPISGELGGLYLTETLSLEEFLRRYPNTIA